MEDIWGGRETQTITAPRNHHQLPVMSLDIENVLKYPIKFYINVAKKPEHLKALKHKDKGNLCLVESHKCLLNSISEIKTHT